MDFRQYETVTRSEEGVPFTPVYPQGHPEVGKPINGTVLTLAGVDSNHYRSTQHAEGRRLATLRAARLEAGEVIDAESTGFALTEIEKQDGGIRILAASTLAWEGVEWDGAVLACTTENAEMLYRQCPWMRDQVDRFVHRRSHFFLGSSEPSPPTLDTASA